MTKQDDSKFTDDEKDAMKAYRLHSYGLKNWEKSSYNQDLSMMLMSYEHDDPHNFSTIISKMDPEQIKVIFNLFHKFYPSQMREIEHYKKPYSESRARKITKPTTRKPKKVVKKCKCK
jgi:hypothetical protein